MPAPITIVNKHHLTLEQQRAATYVGRGSPLGNPFKVKPYGPHERGASIPLYERHLRAALERGDARITRAMRAIRDRARAGEAQALMCFCAPRACHTEVIARVALELLERCDR